MLPTCQSEESIFSMEVPTPQITLLCELTKSNEPKDVSAYIFRTLATSLATYPQDLTLDYWANHIILIEQ